MTPERLAEIEALHTRDWSDGEMLYDHITELLAALDAAVEDNEALRARLAELERVVEFHVARGLSVDAMRFVQKALATPTDGTPAAARTEEVDRG